LISITIAPNAGNNEFQKEKNAIKKEKKACE
jgi:hypothetical protein